MAWWNSYKKLNLSEFFKLATEIRFCFGKGRIDVKRQTSKTWRQIGRAVWRSDGGVSRKTLGSLAFRLNGGINWGWEKQFGGEKVVGLGELKRPEPPTNFEWHVPLQGPQTRLVAFLRAPRPSCRISFHPHFKFDVFWMKKDVFS